VTIPVTAPADALGEDTESFAVTLSRPAGRRYVKAAKLVVTCKAGANRVAFKGRVGKKRLKRGTYRVVVTAVDAAGNRSASRPRGFRIAPSPQTPRSTG
jgi:hypothetical protein